MESFKSVLDATRRGFEKCRTVFREYYVVSGFVSSLKSKVSYRQADDIICSTSYQREDNEYNAPLPEIVQLSKVTSAGPKSTVHICLQYVTNCAFSFTTLLKKLLAIYFVDGIYRLTIFLSLFKMRRDKLPKTFVFPLILFTINMNYVYYVTTRHFFYFVVSTVLFQLFSNNHLPKMHRITLKQYKFGKNETITLVSFVGYV